MFLTAMTGAELVAYIIEILLSGLANFASGIGSGINSLVVGLLFTTSAMETVSTFATIVFVFAGVSLAFTLCRWVLNLITSFGNRNR